MSSAGKPDANGTPSGAFGLSIGPQASPPPHAPSPTGFAAAVVLAAIGDTLAHDVKQPLSAIGAEAAACRNWLASAPSNLSQVLASLRAIGEDARRASELIDRAQQLLSHGESSSEYVLDPWLHEIVHALKPRLRELGLTLGSAPGADGVRVRLDADAWRQVLAHLLRVAVDACQAVPAARRDITLRTRLQQRTPPRFVELTLEYEGAPIAEPPRGLLELLASTHAQAAGLALCRSIVERHGGRLQLLHEPPCSGTIRIALPACGGQPGAEG